MQKLFIGGKWREAASGETLPVVDPSTGETYDTIPRGGAADIDAAVAAARAAYEGAWGALTATERGRILTKMAALYFGAPRGACRRPRRATPASRSARRAPTCTLDGALFRVLRRRRRQAARPDRALSDRLPCAW